MALISEKQLPLEFSNYLQMLTVNKQGLWYTKYIVNKLGLIEPKGQGVKEFPLPPLSGGYSGPNLCPVGIIPDGGLLWLSGIEAGAIARVDPEAKEVTAYLAEGLDPTFLSYRLAIDKEKNIWCKGFTGASGAGSVAVCRLELKNKIVKYWKLSNEFISPFGLWVDADQNVWFTILNKNIGKSGVSFARLNPGNGFLTAWTIGTGYQPMFPGIVGEHGGQAVWITEDNMLTGSHKVYRYDRAKDSLAQFSHADLLRPRNIVLDEPGNAWFTSWDGRINKIARDAPGKPAGFTKAEMQIKPLRKRLTVEKLKLPPGVASPAPSSSADVIEEFGSEIHRWKVPSQGNAVPDAIAFAAGKILFTENTDFQVGGMDAQ